MARDMLLYVGVLLMPTSVVLMGLGIFQASAPLLVASPMAMAFAFILLSIYGTTKEG